MFRYFFFHTLRIYIGLRCVEVDVSLGEYGDDLHRFFTIRENSNRYARVKEERREGGSINYRPRQVSSR